MAASCATRAADAPPPVEPPPAFSSSGAERLPERWWTAFGDPALNELVEAALRSNLDLEVAWQRLREARAFADRESALLAPVLDATGEAGWQRPDFDGSEDVRLGLAAQYEVDLWGRIRSSVDAERHRAAASFADYQTVALSLSAEVARTWFQLIEARGQLELLEEQIETNETVLTLLENRVGIGQTRSVDVLRQRQLLESTREQASLAKADVGVLEHQLAVLLGRPPLEAVAAVRARLPELPPLPETGLPSALVRRRPDVRRAHRQLLAADRDVATAVSDRYPRLTLSGSVAAADSGATGLFEDWIASLMGGLVAPLFDGGGRGAEVDRTEAVKRQRLYEYGQTALTALREVEDALIQETMQRERIRSLEEQVELARRTYGQLRLEYFNGLADYLDVLVALTDEQQLRRERLTAQRTLLELRIALYRALAGGFETHRESSLDESVASSGGGP